MRWLCENRPDLIRCDYLLNEGMGGLWLPIDGKKVFLLAVGEKAFAQFRIRTRGVGGHGSVPEKERSAVIDLARAVVALGLHDPPAIVSPMTASFIDVLVGDGLLASGSRTRRPPASAARELRLADPEIAGLIEPLLGATFTPTILEAGKAVNVIPTHAEASVDCRILPEMTREETRALVAGVVDPLGVDWEFEWIDATEPERVARADARSARASRASCAATSRTRCWPPCARAASPTRAGCARPSRTASPTASRRSRARTCGPWRAVATIRPTSASASRT